MTVLSDTSTARISIIRQAGKDNTVPSTPTFENIPVTSIGVNEQLESSDSAVLRPDRQFSNARIMTGSSGGDIPVEACYGSWFDTFLMGVLQSVGTTWATGADIYNGSNKQYFCLERFFEAGDGDFFQWYKDVQFNSMTLNFDANAFVGASVNVLGVEVEGPATTGKTGATYTDPDMTNQFDTNSVKIVVKDKTGKVIETVAQAGSIEMNNNLRRQAGVGLFYGAGNASGRFSCVTNLTLYFANRNIYTGFKANDAFQIEITITAPDGANYVGVMKNCKATTYDDNIGGVDTDIMIEAAFRANADTSSPSRTITWTKTDA
ncbi:hypothetical protein SIPHO067v1_p0079 [Vibrio phage 51E28.1]|nr:hypothetical protein SIPHO068v1_p0020 [Vibrio phage 51E28.4]QZI92919.1 hypothetical protein SIPHO067v1_p0079 [Vibrio phage 51E28.1]